MKKVMCLLIAGAAAMFVGQDEAAAQCGYGGYRTGFTSYGYSAPGYGVSYSRFTPRSSFSIGFGSYPSYGASFYSGPRRGFNRVYPSLPAAHYHYVPGYHHWHRY